MDHTDDGIDKIERFEILKKISQVMCLGNQNRDPEHESYYKGFTRGLEILSGVLGFKPELLQEAVNLTLRQWALNAERQDRARPATVQPSQSLPAPSDDFSKDRTGAPPNS